MYRAELRQRLKTHSYFSGASFSHVIYNPGTWKVRDKGNSCSSVLKSSLQKNLLKKYFIAQEHQ
jgi:hypothetical protein